MSSDRGTRPIRRISLAPAAIAFLLGIGIHVVDQARAFRAGPVPILLAAPAVATLVYLHAREASVRHVLALTVWGVASSGVAILTYLVLVANYRLPRELTGAEMAVYDFGLFLWFTLTLAGIYAVAARLRRPRAVLAVLAAPLVQAAAAPLTMLLVQVRLFA